MPVYVVPVPPLKGGRDVGFALNDVGDMAHGCAVDNVVGIIPVVRRSLRRPDDTSFAGHTEITTGQETFTPFSNTRQGWSKEEESDHATASEPARIAKPTGIIDPLGQFEGLLYTGVVFQIRLSEV